MCKTGNQTIYAECRNKALQGMGQTRATNAEMRQFILRHGDEGCLMSESKRQERVAQTQEPMLVS